METLPDQRQLVGGNWCAGILDAAAQPLAVGGKADCDRPAVIGVARGVLHQVRDDLTDLVRLTEQPHRSPL